MTRLASAMAWLRRIAAPGAGNAAEKPHEAPREEAPREADPATRARALIERHNMTRVCRHETADGHRRITICGIWRVEAYPDGTVVPFTLDLLRDTWVEGMELRPWPEIPLLGRHRGNGLGWACLAVHMAIDAAVRAVAGRLARDRLSSQDCALIESLDENLIGHGRQAPGKQSVMWGGRTLRAVLFDHVLDREVIAAVLAVDYTNTDLVAYLRLATHRAGLLKVAREHRNLLPLLPRIDPADWSRDDLFSRARWVGPGTRRFTTPAAWRWLLRAPAPAVRAWATSGGDGPDPAVIDNLAFAGITARVPVIALRALLRVSNRLAGLGVCDQSQRVYRLFLTHCADLWREQGHAAVKRWLDQERPLSLVVDWLRHDGWAAGQPDRQATWASLYRRSGEWHDRFGADLDEDDEFDDVAGPFPWAPLPEIAIRGVVFRPLTTVSDLRREGREMRHCVANYAGACQRGEYAVYAVTEPDGTRSTLGLERLHGLWGTWFIALDQHFGPNNRPVSAVANFAALAFARRCRGDFGDGPVELIASMAPASVPGRSAASPPETTSTHGAIA